MIGGRSVCLQLKMLKSTSNGVADSPLFLLQDIFGPSRGPQHTGTALPRDTVVLLVIVPDA